MGNFVREGLWEEPEHDEKNLRRLGARMGSVRINKSGVPSFAGGQRSKSSVKCTIGVRLFLRKKMNDQ